MKFRWLLLAAAFFALALAADDRMRLLHQPRFPLLGELKGGPFAFQDVALAASGFRAPAADIAWIQLLQYAAGNLPALADSPHRPYEHLAQMSLRVARLDPSFHRAILFGAGMMAWYENVKRPDEAADILQEGLRLAPEQPMYSLYLAALAYKKQGDTERMIALLESLVDRPETPSQMKAILANLRQSRGQYPQALELWRKILDSDRDASEHSRARLKINELNSLLRGAKASSSRKTTY
ncbi:MAG: tetratricopeptide repeat protein [Elusimicrobiota bacterium]